MTLTLTLTLTLTSPVSSLSRVRADRLLLLPLDPLCSVATTIPSGSELAEHLRTSVCSHKLK